VGIRCARLSLVIMEWLQSMADAYTAPYESRFKVTGKRQIMAAGVTWLENQCDAHWRSKGEVGGRQTMGLRSDRTEREFTAIGAAWAGETRLIGRRK
jgi:hypothetical protein